MTVFLTFLSIFIPAVLVGFVLLRYTSLSFIYDRAIDFFVGGFTSSLVILVVLLAGCIVLAWFITKPFDQIIKKIKEENYAPTDEEKEKCLLCYKKLNYVVIAVDILGFFVGQLVVVIIGVFAGRYQFEYLKHSLVLLQSLSFGGMGAVVVINGMDALLSKFRQMLTIHNLDTHKKLRISKISSTIIFTFLMSIFFLAVNMLTVVYGGYANNCGERALGKGLFCLVMSVGVSVAAFVFLINGLKQRMTTTTHALNTIAVEGDLTKRIDITVLDDFGQVNSSINTMIGKLSSMVRELSVKTEAVSGNADEISSSVGTASTALNQMSDTLHKINQNSVNQNNLIHQADENILRLTNSVENVKKHIGEQTDAVNTISSSITEMTANINSVAATAKKAQAVSESLSVTTKSGQKEIQNAVASMKEIQESSAEVTNLVKMIQTIAYNTNLLSMNAAIEAAHAGQYGAGFAVVADEVRNLAESSSTGAKDIEKSIKLMADKITAGVTAMNAAGSSFAEIAQRVTENAQFVNTIFSAMEEQNAGAAETQKSAVAVVDIVNSVNTLTKEETEDAEKVREFMKTVVKASESTMNAVTESLDAGEHLKNSIQSVEESVVQNKDSVDIIQKQVNQFTV